MPQPLPGTHCPLGLQNCPRQHCELEVQVVPPSGVAHCVQVPAAVQLYPAQQSVLVRHALKFEPQVADVQ